MKRKPLKLQWDELEAAFGNQNPELVYYLDLVTGYVVLEGEGEEDDSEDESPRFGTKAPQRQPNDATRLYIEPPDHVLKLEWMKHFLEESDDLDAEAKLELKAAAGEDDTVTAINDVLRRHPEGRDHWYLYRSECREKLIDQWIEEHSIDTVDPPPWSS